MSEFFKRLLRHLAVGTLIGLLAGAIAGGLGSRLAMRVSGMMTEERFQNSLTEARARVGEITFGGSLFLIFFAALFGIYGGLLYRVSAAWVPAKTWQKALGFGIYLLLLHGTVLIEGDNFDFERFGSVYLNLAMFMLLPIAFGFIAAYSEAWLERKYPEFGLNPKALLYLPALLGLFVLGMLIVTQVRAISTRGQTGIGSPEQVWLTLVMIALIILSLLFEPILKRLSWQIRLMIFIVPAFYGGFLLFQAIGQILG